MPERPPWAQRPHSHDVPTARRPTQAKKRKGFYHNYDWQKFTPIFKTYNPLCQLIDPKTGQQCTNPTWAVHHLIDPDVRPDLALKPSNCVGLCKHHHDPRKGEDPNRPRQFAPTRWVLGAVFVHQKAVGNHPYSKNLTADGKIVTGDRVLLPPQDSKPASNGLGWLQNYGKNPKPTA